MDAFTADDESETESNRALHMLRAFIGEAHGQRRHRAIEYERLAKRQRRERVSRGRPAEEEDNESVSLESTSSSSSSSSESDSSYEEQE